LALLASLLAPLWLGLGRLARPLMLALTAACLFAAAIAATAPAYSDARPRRLSLVYHHDAEAGAGRWIVDAELPLPAALQAAAEFGAAGRAFAWHADASPSFVAPAEGALSELAAPVIEPEVDTGPPPAIGRRVAVRLR